MSYGVQRIFNTDLLLSYFRAKRVQTVLVLLVRTLSFGADVLAVLSGAVRSSLMIRQRLCARNL